MSYNGKTLFKNAQINSLIPFINDSKNNGIILFANTSKYSSLSDDLKGIFDVQEYVGLPDKTTRIEILKKTLDGKIKAQSIIQNEQDLSEIAEKLDKFSNATIKDLANSAADLAKHENRRNITKEDFFNVIHNNQKRKISDENPYKMNEPRQMGFVLRK